jgi:hypothetical protein
MGASQILDRPDLLAAAEDHHFGTTISPGRVEPPGQRVTMEVEFGVPSHRRPLQFQPKPIHLS